MKKSITKILIIIVAVIVVLLIARNIIIASAVKVGAKAIVGLDLGIKKLNVGLFRSAVLIKDFTVYNPKGYPYKQMAHIPEIFVDYSLIGFLQGKVHVEEIRFDLEEFDVVKNKEGKVNINELKAIQESSQKTDKKDTSKDKPKKKQEIQIDHMSLKIGKVVYHDFSVEPPSKKEFNINVNEKFEDINDPAILVGLVVYKVLARTTISNLANIDLSGLQANVGETLKSTSEALQKVTSQTVDTTKKTIRETTEKLKNILPFGGK